MRIRIVSCLRFLITGSVFAAQRQMSFRSLPKCANQFCGISRLGDKTLAVSVEQHDLLFVNNWFNFILEAFDQRPNGCSFCRQRHVRQK